MTPFVRIASLSLLAATLVACATRPEKVTYAGTLEQYKSFAGEPVDHIIYLGRYTAWKPLGDRQLALWTTIQDAYLLNVLPPCVGLLFANGIQVSFDNRRITRGVDAVSFRDQHCFISEIRPVDYARMQRELGAGP
jgi:hypothetical protein